MGDIDVPFVTEHFTNIYSLIIDQLLVSALSTNYYTETSQMLSKRYAVLEI